MTFRLTAKGDFGTFSFLFKQIQNFSDELSQGITNFNMPNTSAEDTYIFRFTGQNRNINFDFDLVRSDEDLSEGTTPTPILEVRQQKQFLLNSVFMFPASAEASWEIEEVDGNEFIWGKLKVMLSNLRIECVSTEPLRYTGRIELLQGKGYEDFFNGEEE